LQACGRVVWLRARVETLAVRVGDGVGRPLLDGDPYAALRRLDAVRRPLYAEVADDIIDVDELSPDEVATRIVGAGPDAPDAGGRQVSEGTPADA
jgi:shikimate kinase